MKRHSLVLAVFFIVVISSTSLQYTIATSAADNATLESIAISYLNQNGKNFGVGANSAVPPIQLSGIEEAPSYYVVRFTQTYDGIPVYNTTALVMISKSGLSPIHAVTRFLDWARVIESTIDAHAALDAAIAAVQAVTLRGDPKTNKVLYVDRGSVARLSTGGPGFNSPDSSIGSQVAHVSWQVSMSTLEPLGSWSILIDGVTGKVISKQNMIRYDVGEGQVFLKGNPIQTGGNLAWPPPSDLDDPLLTAQEGSVQLLDLKPGTTKLSGYYVDLTAPGIFDAGYKAAGQADEVSRTYDYTRADDRFEEVMVYYYVTSLHRYLQQLGEIYLLNYPVPVHAHYLPIANAFYDSSDLGLHFGDGTTYPNYPIDFAEDADVILHEYGHAIHGDQGLFSGPTSEEMGAFSEGFSDYIATSFLYSGATGTQGCLAEWVGYGLRYPAYPYCLRNTFSTKHYPEDMTGEVHDDGEMWSAALWKLRGLLGQSVADRLAIETGYYVWPSAGFTDAVTAMIEVDGVAYSGVHESIIRKVFLDNGMLGYWVGAQVHSWGPYFNRPINIPIGNRGFEAGAFAPDWETFGNSLIGGVWTTEPSVEPHIVTSPVLSGTYAAELVGSSGLSETESGIYYEFTMPNDATWIRLMFHYRIDTADSSNYDWFEWHLGIPTWYWYDRWLQDTGGQFRFYRNDIWVVPIRGQVCRLTFLLHDDGDVSYPTSVYLDGNAGLEWPWDISLRWNNVHAPLKINTVTRDSPPEFWVRVKDGSRVTVFVPREVIVAGLTYRFMEWDETQDFDNWSLWYRSGIYTVKSFIASGTTFLSAEYQRWSGWQKTPGTVKSSTPPTIVYDAPNELEHVFVRGIDQKVYHITWQSGLAGGWSSWEDLGLKCKGQPAAGMDSEGRIHVVATGLDDQLQHRIREPSSGWGPWLVVPSAFKARLPTLQAITYDPNARVDLITLSSDGSLMHNFWDKNTGWKYSGTWEQVSPTRWPTTGSRAVLAYDWAIDRLYLVVRRADKSIWHSDLTVASGTWGTWLRLGTIEAMADPTVLAANGRLDLTIQGFRIKPLHAWRLSTESPDVIHVETLPGATTASPTAAYRYGPHDEMMLEVLVKHTDALYRATLDVQTGTLTAWTRLPGSVRDMPVPIVNQYSDEMYLLSRGADNTMNFAVIIVWTDQQP